MANYGYQGSQYGSGAPPYGAAGGPPADYNQSSYYAQSPPPPHAQQQQQHFHHPQQQQQQQPPYQNYQYHHTPPPPPQQTPTPQQHQQPYQPPPHVAAPEPYHARPQMQDNLTNGLARLDMNARPPPHHQQSPYTSTSSPSSAYTPHPGAEYSPAHGFESSSARPSPLNVAHPPAQYPQHSAPTPHQQQPQSQLPPPHSQTPAPAATPIDTSFPGLPKLPYRTANIPESDEERGARLDRDRLAILGSSNFEDQLGWAQDALNWVDAAAEQNARLVLLGQGRTAIPPMETQLRSDAVNVTEHMAQQRHPRATFMKGMWLEFGKFGHAEDKRDAFEHFSRAARAGYARAEYRIGMQFEATGSPSQAIQHYRAGEQAGDAASCYRMGMICALGQLSQPQDYARAVTLIRHAAEHADDNAPQGAYVYGMLLSNDLPQIKIPEQFLQPDLDAGKRYIEKSAWLGFSKAQLKMASAYEVASLHCEVNPALSMHYSALAARQGEPEAEMALSKWFVVGSDGIFAKNERLAYMYAERAAGSGLPIAYFAMGYFNEVGAGVAPNVDVARSWYQKAAGEGNREAADALARLSNNQQLSMRDHEDVAVARIKSTHGSKRGGPRPARLQQRVAAASSLATVPDEAGPHYYPQAASYTRPLGATPPPPQPHQAPQSHQQQYQQQAQPPPRGSSVAPYPLDDARPVSAAPYPGADPRPSMPSLPPQHQQHDPYAPQHQQPGYPGQQQPLRPYSTTSGPPGPPGQAPQAYAPRPSPSPQPAPYATAHPPPIRAHQQSHPQPRPPQQQGQRIPSGPPGPARPPKEPAPPSQSAYTGPVPSSRPPPAPSSSSSSTPSLPNVSARPPSARVPSGPGPGPGAGAAPTSRPGSRPGSAAPSAGSTPRPQYSTPAAVPGGGAPASAGKARPAAAVGGGHGPKTFDQMGVPAAKNESECVLM